MAVMHSQNGVIIRESGINIIGGKKYKTVKMPDGKIWLAENLDFKFCNVGGSGTPTTPNAWYYDNNETTYGWSGYKCGLLYNWYAVKFLNDNRSELCPGWHVPSTTDYNDLASAISDASTVGTKLKALDNSAGANWPSGWNGSDNYGFKVLPCGNYNNGTFWVIGQYCDFWTSYEDSSDTARSKVFSRNPGMTNGINSKRNGYSLRLVRDSN